MSRTVELPNSPANLHPLPAAIRALLRPGLKVMAHGTEATIVEVSAHGLFARVDGDDELLACRWVDVDICLADIASEAEAAQDVPGAPVLPHFPPGMRVASAFPIPCDDCRDDGGEIIKVDELGVWFRDKASGEIMAATWANVSFEMASDDEANAEADAA